MNEDGVVQQVWPYYAIAMLASIVIVAAGLGFVARTRKSLFRYLREEVEESADEDDIHERDRPDLLTQLEREESLDDDFGSEVPDSLFVRMQYADILAAWWYFWCRSYSERCWPSPTSS